MRDMLIGKRQATLEIDNLNRGRFDLTSKNFKRSKLL
jgi:hypothetical protein